MTVVAAAEGRALAWVYLDDTMPEHPKIVLAESRHIRAPWLFICGLAYSRRQMSGGLIPKTVIPTLVRGYSSKMKDALTFAALWDLLDDGSVVVHDYDEWNASEDLQREARKEKARKAALKRWEAARNDHA